MPELNKININDAYGSGTVVIDSVHENIHKGFVYHASNKFTTVANGASAELLLVVPALTFPHFHRFKCNTGAGNIDVYFFEGTTVSANGTQLTAGNINRNSSNTPDMDVYHTPTITGDGTQVAHHWSPPTGAGIGNTIGVTDITNGEEWLLKPSTNYLIRITNNSGGSIDIWTEFLWYELNNA